MLFFSFQIIPHDYYNKNLVAPRRGGAAHKNPQLLAMQVSLAAANAGKCHLLDGDGGDDNDARNRSREIDHSVSDQPIAPDKRDKTTGFEKRPVRLLKAA